MFKHLQANMTELERYALSRGFKSVSVTFDANIQYNKQTASYFTLEADELCFCGTYESIMNELASIPKEVIEYVKN